MAGKEIKLKPALPLYGVGVVWLIYSLFFQLYRLTDFVIASALSIIFYLVLSKFIPTKTIFVEEVDFAKSGNKTADGVISKGKQMLDDLLVIRDRIDQQELREAINKIFHIGEEIYDYISKNPQSVSNIRRFNDYYFPETLKLLRAYDDIDDIRTSGKNVEDAKEKIKTAVQSMVGVFTKQLDNLLYDKTFDIRTDIQVLETLLAEEGLAKKEEPTNRDKE